MKIKDIFGKEIDAICATDHTKISYLLRKVEELENEIKKLKNKSRPLVTKRNNK